MEFTNESLSMWIVFVLPNSDELPHDYVVFHLSLELTSMQSANVLILT